MGVLTTTRAAGARVGAGAALVRRAERVLERDGDGPVAGRRELAAVRRQTSPGRRVDVQWTARARRRRRRRERRHRVRRDRLLPTARTRAYNHSLHAS